MSNGALHPNSIPTRSQLETLSRELDDELDDELGRSWRRVANRETPIVPMFLASRWHKVPPGFRETRLSMLSTMMASFICLLYTGCNLSFITVIYMQVIEVYYNNVNK